MIYGTKKQRIINLLREAPSTIDELALITESTRRRTASMLYWLKLQGAVKLSDKKVPIKNKRGRQQTTLWEAA
jgi:hypothetical protein